MITYFIVLFSFFDLTLQYSRIISGPVPRDHSWLYSLRPHLVVLGGFYMRPGLDIKAIPDPYSFFSTSSINQAVPHLQCQKLNLVHM